MKFSLKHSKNVGLEKLGKDTYCSGWAARTLNADRIMKDHENDKWNLGQLMDVESILRSEEGTAGKAVTLLDLRTHAQRQLPRQTAVTPHGALPMAINHG